MSEATERPLILVTNDDGYSADGILTLADALEALGEVWMVAPERQRSGVSRMITLHKPLRVRRFRQDRPYFWCSGTPTDAVYVGLNHVVPRLPALVVSGVNLGANLGDDVMYSGTVAGAMEASAFGVPALAVSVNAHRDTSFEPSVALAVEVSRKILAHGLAHRTLLNLNVPDAYDASRGMLVTRLGNRGYERVVHLREDPRGGEYYWIGGPALPLDDLPGTDCRAIHEGIASLTPIHLDLNAPSMVDKVSSWFQR